MLSSRSTTGICRISPVVWILHCVSTQPQLQSSHNEGGKSLQRRSIAHQNELQPPNTYPSGSTHHHLTPLSSFKTRPAVRRCALPVQTVTAIWSAFVKQWRSPSCCHPQACVSHRSLVMLLGRLRSLIRAKRSKVASIAQSIFVV